MAQTRPMTAVEKILARASGKESVSPGDIERKAQHVIGYIFKHLNANAEDDFKHLVFSITSV